MKYPVLCLSIISLSSFAYTPLDMKPGLWEYRTDTSAMMEAMLANVPEAQREMVKKMMKSKQGAGMAAQINKPIYQCQTAEMIKDPQAVYESQKKQNPKMSKCDFKMLSSSKSKAEFKVTCDEGEMKGDIKVKIEAKSRTKQVIESEMPFPQAGTKVKSIATWVSDDCSKATKFE